MDDEIPNQRISIQIARVYSDVSLASEKIQKLVESIYHSFGASEAIISIAIVDDAQIKKINNRFLEHNNVTDVLSFNLSDDQDNEQKCFEIVVNAELAARQAPQRKHSAHTELALYITHGLLHQLGFDDHKPDSAKEMHRTEEKILQQLGYDYVYDWQ